MPERSPPDAPLAATYRLQFNRGFRFTDARALVPYLRDLGVTELYASPIFRAIPGSLHGYDVTDSARLNPELGAARDFNALVRDLERHGLGLMLDIVPNHMAASPENMWWADVLSRGRASRFARFFDIDWDAAPGGRLVLPILGDPLDAVLDRGELSVARDAGTLVLRYHETKLPLALGSYEAIPGRSRASPAQLGALNRDISRLARLLEDQHYELAYWREGVRRINYRRFFDVSGLVGVRVEKPEVFEATHRLITRLLRDGPVTGLRVDHVDGLRDPLQYLRRLRRAAWHGRRDPSVIVEKILLDDEQPPSEWPIEGTTGYEFLDLVNAVLVHPRGLQALAATYRRFTGSRKSFGRIAYESRRRAIRDLFSSELRDLSRRLHELALGHGEFLTAAQCERAIAEVSARLPVYRTYIRDYRVDPRDRALIERAVADAGRRSRSVSPRALRFLRRVLLLRSPPSLAAAKRRRWLEFVLRWQQFTGPVAAKGVEDTALYRYNRLVSLNVVGGDPSGARIVGAVERFHHHNATTLKRWPRRLNATSTHDTKRSEDVRARIDVLSEMPDAWDRRINRWTRMNRVKKRRLNGRLVPDANEETLLYQSLVGAWPLDAEDMAEFAQRISDYTVKAAREAKVNTSWLEPSVCYEAAIAAFVETILEDSKRNEFLEDFRRFHKRIAPGGATNSLAQVLLKVASPGRPDFYQGSELWDFSLVDPDNRRPVQFEQSRRLLGELRSAARGDQVALAGELLASWPDGRIKLYVTAAALAFRNRNAELFASGRYVPLAAEGALRDNVIGFARARRGHWAVAAVPRLTSALSASGRPPIGRRTWKGTALQLPEGAPREWRNVLTGEDLSAAESALDCGDLFRRLPVVLLSSGGPSPGRPRRPSSTQRQSTA